MPDNNKTEDKNQNTKVPEKVPENDSKNINVLDQLLVDNKTMTGFGPDDIKLIYSGANIFDRGDLERFDKFSQYGYFDVYDTSTYYKEYLFFTKPHLSVKGLQQYDSTYFDMLTKHYPKVVESLTSGGKGFIPLLTNSASSSDGAEVPDSTPIDMETMVNVYGAGLTYKSQSLESNYNTELTLTFNDTQFLDVYMLFHYWDKYSTLKSLGYVEPDPKFLPPTSQLEDQISIYKIIVAEDFETIVYYAKYTGVYPKNLPRSVFTTLEAGILKMPITFKAFYFEDNNPIILSEFNSHSEVMKSNSNKKDQKKEYVGFATVDNRWKSTPKVETGKLHGREVYKLKWEV